MRDRQLTLEEFVSCLTTNVEKWGHAWLKERIADRQYIDSEERSEIASHIGSGNEYQLIQEMEGSIIDRKYDFNMLLEEFIDQL